MQDQQFDPTTLGPAMPHQQVMREVNQKIFEFGSRMAARYSASDELYSFFCECEDPGCDRTISLHLHRFDPTMPAGSLLAHVTEGELDTVRQTSLTEAEAGRLLAISRVLLITLEESTGASALVSSSFPAELRSMISATERHLEALRPDGP